MKTTRITAPDGSVTTMKTKSSWGCLTIFALAVVFGLPAGFPPPFDVLAYVGLGIVVFLGGIGWIAQKTHPQRKSTPTAAPQHITRVTPDGKWITFDDGVHFEPYAPPPAAP